MTAQNKRQKALDQLIGVCAVGLIIDQWETEDGSKWSKYNTVPGQMVIQEFPGGGFEVFKSSPHIGIDETIQWVDK